MSNKATALHSCPCIYHQTKTYNLSPNNYRKSSAKLLKLRVQRLKTQFNQRYNPLSASWGSTRRPQRMDLSSFVEKSFWVMAKLRRWSTMTLNLSRRSIRIFTAALISSRLNHFIFCFRMITNLVSSLLMEMDAYMLICKETVVKSCTNLALSFQRSIERVVSPPWDSPV